MALSKLNDEAMLSSDSAERGSHDFSHMVTDKNSLEYGFTKMTNSVFQQRNKIPSNEPSLLLWKEHVVR